MTQHKFEERVGNYPFSSQHESKPDLLNEDSIILSEDKMSHPSRRNQWKSIKKTADLKSESSYKKKKKKNLDEDLIGK